MKRCFTFPTTVDEHQIKKCVLYLDVWIHAQPQPLDTSKSHRLRSLKDVPAHIVVTLSGSLYTPLPCQFQELKFPRDFFCVTGHGDYMLNKHLFFLLRKRNMKGE